jgi:hypothetical protein
LLQRWDTPDRYERLRTKNYTSSKESVSSAKPAGHALTIVEYIRGASPGEWHEDLRPAEYRG